MDQIVVRHKVIPVCACGNGCSSNRHHRKPRSIGGLGNSLNVSKLPTCLHSAWHQVFYNWGAERIAWYISRLDLIEEDVVAVPSWWHVSPSGICKADAISTSVLYPMYDFELSLSAGSSDAWYNLLFGHLGTSAEIVTEINRYYLDPDYRIALVQR